MSHTSGLLFEGWLQAIQPGRLANWLFPTGPVADPFVTVWALLFPTIDTMADTAITIPLHPARAFISLLSYGKDVYWWASRWLLVRSSSVFLGVRS